MSIIKKSGDVLGQLLGLFSGKNFTMPSYKVVEKYPGIPY